MVPQVEISMHKLNDHGGYKTSAFCHVHNMDRGCQAALLQV